MIQVNEADKLVEQNLWSANSRTVPFSESQGKILAEDIRADRPFPPFDRVAMDGIAIKYSTFQEGKKSFPVQGVGRKP